MTKSQKPECQWAAPKTRSGISFGDYVTIEHRLYGDTPIKHIQYKVINSDMQSSYSIKVPIDHGPGGTGKKEIPHGGIKELVYCIQCGLQETEVLRFKKDDVVYQGTPIRIEPPKVDD